MARRARGAVTTLGEMRRKEPTCAICGLAMTTGQAVAWTVGRDRIPESCIDLARIAAPGRAKFGPWKAAAVRVLLQQTGGRLCASCLAMALSVSLDQARDVMRVVDSVAGLYVLPIACASCGRSTTVLCVVPLSASDRAAS